MILGFKRIHCITFGAPPISLLPLSLPRHNPRFRKSLFLSFVNEGDPVARADKAYIRSLLNLYTHPVPNTPQCAPTSLLPQFTGMSLRPPATLRRNSAPAGVAATEQPVWKIPPGALSSAGRICILRQGPGGKDDVVVQIATDEMMRAVVFGDPLMHAMGVYARRVEVLATRAVTGRAFVG
jgi:hypothetical protein